MWYSTEYIGKAKITPSPTIDMVNDIKWIIKDNDWHSELRWNLQVSDDLKYIEWTWNEKTYGFEETLNVLIKEVRRTYPDFDLEWEFEYQWDEWDDRWYVRKVDWVFVRIEKWLEKDEYKCPEC